jgi:hypothetical protein
MYLPDLDNLCWEFDFRANAMFGVDILGAHSCT